MAGGVDRPTDWLGDAEQLIRSRALTRLNSNDRATLEHRMSRIVSRLTSLFLDRLEPELAHQLVSLLPESRREVIQSLQVNASASADAAIGYTDFVERSSIAAGKPLSDEDARALADAFLWGIAAGIPADLKARLVETLPTELKSRMDLFSDRQSDSKVA